mmetsp:Transcript_5956/g.11012  ORF Transcript_5956/g.11012 Transcript_5956/m.11012 type:complete len:278 (-) Transcript_5956:2129-2962(-)
MHQLHIQALQHFLCTDEEILAFFASLGGVKFLHFVDQGLLYVLAACVPLLYRFGLVLHDNQSGTHHLHHQLWRGVVSCHFQELILGEPTQLGQDINQHHLVESDTSCTNHFLNVQGDIIAEVIQSPCSNLIEDICQQLRRSGNHLPILIAQLGLLTPQSITSQYCHLCTILSLDTNKETLARFALVVLLEEFHLSIVLSIVLQILNEHLSIFCLPYSVTQTLRWCQLQPNQELIALVACNVPQIVSIWDADVHILHPSSGLQPLQGLLAHPCSLDLG